MEERRHYYFRSYRLILHCYYDRKVQCSGRKQRLVFCFKHNKRNGYATECFHCRSNYFLFRSKDPVTNRQHTGTYLSMAKRRDRNSWSYCQHLSCFNHRKLFCKNNGKRMSGMVSTFNCYSHHSSNTCYTCKRSSKLLPGWQCDPKHRQYSWKNLSVEKRACKGHGRQQ